MSREPSPPPGSPAPGRAGELCVFLDCLGFLVAVAVKAIDRLILASEVEAADGSAVEIARLFDGQDLVRVADAPFVAWDLSLLLAVTPFTSAFILLRIGHAGREIPVALRTGPCLFIKPLSGFTPLPPGVFRGRPGAIAGAFSAAALTAAHGGGGARMGLYLDPARLWTPAELDGSILTLNEAGPLEAPL
jgi:hypothetical protein